MDTTLRDGEQTTSVSFTDKEKLTIAKYLLEEVRVDRLEIASARVSEGEYQGVKRVAQWARDNGYIDKIEVLGFVDGTISADWILETGGKVNNLLTKGSLNHVTHQLRKTPEEHVKNIRAVVEYCDSKGIDVNIYFEDWSNGMISSRDYVFYLVDSLMDLPIKRFMLPDTLGILNPDQTKEFCTAMIERYPNLHFDFHSHNDYDFAVANTFEALKAGIKGIHTTVNGLGERAGNAPLSSIVGMLNDHLKLENSINESSLYKVSRLIENISGLRIPTNKPIIGEYVFTQVSGIHADGDNKHKLYFNNLLPERFGRTRQYAMGKTSGKANIKQNLEKIGVNLDPEEMKLVTQRIIELGDKKERVTTEDLPYIIADVLRSSQIESQIKIVNYSLSLSFGLQHVATIKIEIKGKTYEATSAGDGQYDAFMKALKSIYARLKKPFPTLEDYVVTIPPGGKTDALVSTSILWKFNDREFKTRGLDSDQTEAAIKATEKMLNIIENGKLK